MHLQGRPVTLDEGNLPPKRARRAVDRRVIAKCVMPIVLRSTPYIPYASTLSSDQRATFNVHT